MIRFSEVTKRYGQSLALDRLTLPIPSGAVFGLLGPNGSGKSTLINLLMGFIFPDAGQIDRGELAPFQFGYVPERPSFPPRCPAEEYLSVAGRLGGMSDAILRDAVAMRLHQVGLGDVARKRVNQFSKGMLQRLALAQALLGNPAFLVLDEPMNGLDPVGQKQVRDLVKALHGEGRTILFSTHRLEDVVDVCTHVAILKRGRLVRAGALAEMLPSRTQVVMTVDRLTDAVRSALMSQYPSLVLNGNTITLNDGLVAQKTRVMRDLLDAGVDICQLTQSRATLEEIYWEAMR
jgi:ABC-2 type transport system ATP-binding protein